MNTLDILTIFSYLALNVDILFQIARIYRTKSSHDISLVGLSIRYAAVLVILAKFTSLGDLPLIAGQGFIALTMTLYLALAFIYARRATS